VEKGQTMDAVALETLRQLNGSLQSVVTSMQEDQRLLHDIHERVIRIESNRLESQVSELERKFDKMGEKVDALERDRDRRDGVMGLAGWLAKHAPWLVAILISAFAIVGIDKIAD
jgi:hypothetical protein